jgi:hypothetical protein
VKMWGCFTASTCRAEREAAQSSCALCTSLRARKRIEEGRAKWESMRSHLQELIGVCAAETRTSGHLPRPLKWVLQMEGLVKSYVLPKDGNEGDDDDDDDDLEPTTSAMVRRRSRLMEAARSGSILPSAATDPARCLFEMWSQVFPARPTYDPRDLTWVDHGGRKNVRNTENKYHLRNIMIMIRTLVD